MKNSKKKLKQIKHTPTTVAPQIADSQFAESQIAESN